MFYELHHIVSPKYFKKEYGENFSFPPHMHQCFEIAIVLDGNMTITVSNKIYNLSRGEAIFIFPNQLHSFSSEKSKHMILIFSPKIVQSFSVKYSEMLPTSAKFVPDKHLVSALDALEPQDSVIAMKGLLYSVSADFERQASFSESYSNEDDLLMKIFKYVDANYRGECTLEAAAHAMGYDHAYISRYFKKATGISYNSYVNMCRLSNASYLLKNSDLSVLECSIESGYKSLRSFNRNFKEYFSATPLEYKRGD